MTANIKFKQAVFFRQNDPLRDEFNNAQNELKKNGFIASLYKKWFGVTPGPDSDANKIYTTPYIPDK
jgi:ABC-type amino acid transport substrate-binding protein